MEDRHRELRAELREMSPRRARALVEGFELPPDEERSVIECDIRRRSSVSVALDMGLTVDGLLKIRRRAYVKMTSERAAP